MQEPRFKSFNYAIGMFGRLGASGEEIYVNTSLACSLDFIGNCLRSPVFCKLARNSSYRECAGVVTTMDLIGAKIMDEDTKKYNLRREGIIVNALGFMNRLNGLFTSFAFYLIFVIFQFESGNNPGPDPLNASRFLLTVFPFVLMLISFGFSFLVNFPKNDPTKPIVELNPTGEA
jgi:hypothetical protein